MSADVTIDINEGVAVLTLNRPDHLNAYTADMGRLLSQAYRECDGDDDVRALVLTGAGGAFCVGADFSGNISPFEAPADDSAFSASRTARCPPTRCSTVRARWPATSRPTWPRCRRRCASDCYGTA